MNAEAQAVWTWIETQMLGDEARTLWANNASYGAIVDEDHIDEMVGEIFGGYWDSEDNRGAVYEFRNGDVQYKLKALPLQNKFNRAENAYQTFRDNENKVNLIAWRAAGGGNVFNLHISVRRLRNARAARKRKDKKNANGSGGWQDV